MKSPPLLLVAMLAPALPAAAQRPQQRPPPASDTDPWNVVISRSEMTDQPYVHLALDALNLVPGPVFEVRPVLYVRCQEGQLDVLITTGAVLDSDDRLQRVDIRDMPKLTPIRIRWASDTAQEEEWLLST